MQENVCFSAKLHVPDMTKVQYNKKQHNFSFIASLPLSFYTATCSAVFCNYLQQITHTHTGCEGLSDTDLNITPGQ
jgi:hypothetical protein